MQWILQPFEDMEKLAHALDRLGIAYSWHKVVPFVGDLIPEPEVRDPKAVVLFGAYTLWRYARAKGLSPGVFTIRPFVEEAPWGAYLLNGPGAKFCTLREIAEGLADDGRLWFLRPVADGKEQAGKVRPASEILEIARKVMTLDPEEIPQGSLRPETRMMLTQPARILKEWRIWIVRDEVVTASLYKEGARVTYRPEIDADALAFAQDLARLNPGYAPAYVMDICRTESGLKLLETNCINAAGFYAADLMKLAAAIDALG
ncbi:DUF4343 domain-containing protein [Rhodobacter capsulatus]|uniref:DUF4343 domain-containing protein n=1 Tax=Rhodobacter capsulatus TaxID=1061 RepID=A0A4U1JQ08_RHOCA|nr:ATP-grasp domain-containing protein [Rhodobacter capsulatus]TKD17913.1 DUF4343 domain-containing protein [Rhodobacter capsulatus]